MKTMCTMFPLHFCIPRRHQPSPTPCRLSFLHTSTTPKGPRHDVSRIQPPSVSLGHNLMDFRPPLCSKGSFSCYDSVIFSADRICGDIHESSDVLWERSVYQPSKAMSFYLFSVYLFLFQTKPQSCLCLPSSPVTN